MPAFYYRAIRADVSDGSDMCNCGRCIMTTVPRLTITMHRQSEYCCWSCTSLTELELKRISYQPISGSPLQMSAIAS